MNGMNPYMRFFKDSKRLATFGGIVLVASGIGLALDLVWPGFLVGLGLALINVGRDLQVADR